MDMWVHMRTSVANGKSYALQERVPLPTRHVSVSFRLVGIHKSLGCTSPRISWLATALGNRRNGGAYEQRDCNGTEDTAGPHEGEYVGRLVATWGRLAKNDVQRRPQEPTTPAFFPERSRNPLRSRA